MDLLEVAVRELVVPLGVVVHRVVDPEVPQAVVLPAVLVEVLVLLVGGRLVLAPVVALVGDELTVADQLLRVLESPVVQLDRHLVPPSRRPGAPKCCPQPRDCLSRLRGTGQLLCGGGSPMTTQARRATLWIVVAAAVVALVILLVLLSGTGGGGGGGGGY